MNKESIKNILKNGGSIEVPFKTRIDEWYAQLRISKLSKDEYVIQPGWQKFSDLDEAVNWFLNEGFTSKNVGYIQSRLNNKGIDFEDEYDLEKPNSKLKKLFKDEGKLVDEEAKKLNIFVKPLPTEEEALVDMEIMIKNITVDNLKESLSEFERKYMPLDPYINLSFVYDSGKHEYRSGIQYSSFSKNLLNESKNNSKLKYKHVGLTIKIKNGEHNRYELNF